MLVGEQGDQLFDSGSRDHLYRQMGCQLQPDGAHFRVWAPNASAVSVIGEWNGWRAEECPLQLRDDESGVWEGHDEQVRPGCAYKFHIVGPDGGTRYKADPYAFYSEAPPATASRAWDLEYAWRDASWMSARRQRNSYSAPISIYEVHLGSWRRLDSAALPTYRAIAAPLADYVRGQGFTHVELMPVTEHPFYGSWGYQTTGYFAATARYGTPQDLMYLIDVLHQAGIGVILDWVPSHFPTDAHGLAVFDGTHLFEHADSRRGTHPQWGSAIFNYDRPEVRSFLLSSALFWLECYHIDALRVDAVASMLYLDYARPEGEWIPNVHGGRENLGAVQFLRQLNEAVQRAHPDVQVIAEESTAWPMVSRPTSDGGLGFGLKWNMGWMHDTLAYLARNPDHRGEHYAELTFAPWYAFDENFVLPLSHDEVVHGKASLLNKMPGDLWQQFANLRLLFGYMWAHPGKKLLFMGGEFGQRREWAHERALDWDLLSHLEHAGLQRWVHDLNLVYRNERALHELDFDAAGFAWVDADNAELGVLSFERHARVGEPMLVICNLTAVPRYRYTVGVPSGGRWREVLNSDATVYGGSGVGNLGGVQALEAASHGRPHCLVVTVPPLAVVYLTPGLG